MTFKCNQQSTSVWELVFVADALGSVFYLIYHCNVLNTPECHTLNNSVYRLCYSRSLFLTKDLGTCRTEADRTVTCFPPVKIDSPVWPNWPFCHGAASSLFMLNITHNSCVWPLSGAMGWLWSWHIKASHRRCTVESISCRDPLSHGLSGTVYCLVWNAGRLPITLCLSSSLRAQETFLQWDQFRRFYNFLMADNMKKIILSHR